MTPVLAASLEDRGVDVGDVLGIDHVVRTFKDGRRQLTAVADVSLSLRKGETFGLVGESGSGKTTLAECVTGLIPADSGTITFEGGVLKSTAGRRSQDSLRAIQMVFQNPDSTLNPAWSTRAILRARCASWAAPRPAPSARRSTRCRRTCGRATLPLPEAH